jgi:hypothetical protein
MLLKIQNVGKKQKTKKKKKKKKKLPKTTAFPALSAHSQTSLPLPSWSVDLPPL